MKTARSQWLAEEEGGIDDCTAIVCILRQGDRAPPVGPPVASALPSEAAKGAGAISRYVLLASKPLQAGKCSHIKQG